MTEEEDLLQNYLTDQDIPGITAQEFQTAVLGLIEKGLMVMVEVNGVKLYRPTPLLRKIKTHLNSDPATQN